MLGEPAACVDWRRKPSAHRPALADRNHALATAGAIDADGPEHRNRRRGTAATRLPPESGMPPRPRGAAYLVRRQGQAFTTVVEDVTPGQRRTGRAMIAGIAAPGQGGRLSSPFTRRFFRRSRSSGHGDPSEVAQSVVIGLYPHWDIAEQGITAAEEFLSDPEVPPAAAAGARGQAAVQRSLRARNFDADG
ncbi:hypothetical protein ABLN97_01785 [Mycobacterium tuberculosis]